MNNTIIAILIDKICIGSDNGLAIMLGIDDLARERLALSILTLAALGFRAFYSWLAWYGIT